MGVSTRRIFVDRFGVAGVRVLRLKRVRFLLRRGEMFRFFLGSSESESS